MMQQDWGLNKMVNWCAVLWYERLFIRWSNCGSVTANRIMDCLYKFGPQALIYARIYIASDDSILGVFWKWWWKRTRARERISTLRSFWWKWRPSTINIAAVSNKKLKLFIIRANACGDSQYCCSFLVLTSSKLWYSLLLLESFFRLRLFPPDECMVGGFL